VVRIFETAYGSPKAVRRNAILVVVMSVVLYAMAVVLGIKGGWDAAFPVLLVAVVVDAFCLVVWAAFRSKNR
jgi:CHASE2 domain-containing sensor protein